MGDVGQDQAAINARLLADNEELRANLRAITAELSQLRQGGRPNGPRPPRRNQPDPHDTDSDTDSTDDTRSQDEERLNRGGSRNMRGHLVKVGGGRNHRGGRDREEEKPPWIGGKTMMSQFLEGLQDRIARKVERQQYEDFNDLLHFATQAEQHIKRKTTSASRSKPAWTQPGAKHSDKGKAIEIKSRFKTNKADSSNAPKPD